MKERCNGKNKSNPANGQKKNKHIEIKYVNYLGKKIAANKGLSVGHLNTRSILPKIEELRVMLKKSKLDILTISESWLDNSVLPHEIEIENYTVIRKDRNRQGGGVMQYISNSLEYKERSDLNHERVEAIWLELQATDNNTKYLICSYYRSPDKDVKYFNDTIDMINKASNEGKEIIICGDFNWDYKFDDSLSTHKVKQLEDIFVLHQLVQKPTRTEDGDKILDLILTSTPQNHIYTDVLPIGCSDHYMPYTIIKIQKQIKRDHNYASIRSYKHFQADEFLYDLELQRRLRTRNRGVQLSANNFTNKPKEDIKKELDQVWKLWKEDFIEISDKHAPIKTVRMKQNMRCWITPDIAKLINRRDQMKLTAKLTNNQENWNEYRNLRNKVKRMIDKEKKDYYKNVVNTKQSNTNFWKEMTKLVPKKINMASIPKSLTLDELNTFFADIGSKNIAEMANKKKIPGMPWKGPESIHNFEIELVDEDDILNNLKKLKLKTNTDILGFDCKLLRISRELIYKELTYFINLSIMADSVPSDWKIARVTPVYKGNGNKEDPTNYRPISVVCHIAKIFEKVIAHQFISYLNTNNLITSDQSAYLYGRSTQTSLHRVIDDILQSMDDGEITAACFIDIAKCFDSIDHTFLLEKLKKHGIRKNIDWFKSYLSGRQQRVIYNGKLSEAKFVKAGVPQGSVLGPFLFILFANDISNFTGNGQINCYADDALIYVSGTNMKEVETKLQDCINKVEFWYTENKLKVNTKKTEVMIFGTAQKLSRISDDICIKFGQEQLRVVKHFKYLGVHLDGGLSWNDHCQSIISKAGYKLHLMRRLNKILPKKTMIQIYKTYMMPILEYAATVWGYTSAENNTRIQRIINLCARIISNNYDFINCRGEDLAKELGWNSFKERRDFLLAVLMFKCHDGSAPEYISDNLDLHKEVNIRESRHTDDTTYKIPGTRINITDTGLFVQGPTVWNKIPAHIREADSVELFKKQYKKEILGKK